MSLFYVKNEQIFIPEAINPELAKLARAIVKTCRLSLKLQLKTNAINNAIKSGDKAQMHEMLQKAFTRNRSMYNNDMSLTGASLETVDDGFFADKDEAFYENQLRILLDFAAINCVIESKMFPVMSGACEKTLGKPINQVLFFTNQTEILEETEDGEEAEASAAESEGKDAE